MQVLKQALRRAILERRRIRFNYGHYSRLVEPYLLGRAGGGTMLCAWQVSGGDEAQEPTGWKVFAVAEIRGMTLFGDERFAGQRKLPHDLRQRFGSVVARVKAAAAAPYAGSERRTAPRSGS